MSELFYEYNCHDSLLALVIYLSNLATQVLWCFSGLSSKLGIFLHIAHILKWRKSYKIQKVP